MSNDLFLGIDTSNYTTSVALIDAEGTLVCNLKRPLPVKAGERGIRQSDAVFSHVKNLPDIMEEAREYISGNNILAVGVSTRPRNTTGSYMPCFLAGVSCATGISSAVGAPLFSFSHQCGHIMAAIYSSGAFGLLGKPFGALHISGGTTELLSVKGYSSLGFEAQLVGGTKDLNAGQIIDRIGVLMGLPFPAGPHMERLALSYNGKIPRVKPSVDGLYFNLSGLENQASKLYHESGDAALVSAFVFASIGDAIESICKNYEPIYGICPFVFAGGVMSNSILKARLLGSFDAYFAEPALSADNAVGIARLTQDKYKLTK